MIEIVALSKAENRRRFVAEFIQFPKTLYRNEPNWIPWFDVDMKRILSGKHPFFGHSKGEFFIAREDARPVGRICVVANTRYAQQHGRKPAHFFFLDAIERQDVFHELLDAAAAWGKEAGCEALEGPMLFGGTYGSGVLVEGYDSPAPLTMMPYNFPYYVDALDNYGFHKLFDVVGADISPSRFSLPAKVSSVAEKVLKRGRFSVLEFRSKADLKKRADEVARLYNATLADHYENYPLTEAELEFVKNDMLAVADPRLMKILQYDGNIVGFLFAFHDLNPVLRQNMGRVTPLGLARLLLGFRQRRKLYFNGMGILPDYQRLGGNALLYHELTRTVSQMGIGEAEIVQINEHTDLMLADIQRLGATITKRHRIYTRPFEGEPYSYGVGLV